MDLSAASAAQLQLHSMDTGREEMEVEPIDVRSPPHFSTNSSGEHLHHSVAALSEQQRVEQAAWLLEHAQQGVMATQYPVGARDAHVSYLRSLSVLHWVLIMLIVLSLFEPPFWCKDACRSKTNLMGVPLLPRWAGNVLSMTLLLVVSWHLRRSQQLDHLFRAVRVDPKSLGRAPVEPFYVLVTLGILENVIALIFQFIDHDYEHALWPDSLQPLLRVLLLFRLPNVRTNVQSMKDIFIKVASVLVFFAGIIFFFAWIATVIFDDWESEAHVGFETFGSSLITLFSLGTTASLPDSMVAPFGYSRATVLIFAPFLFFTQIVFLQVILATVFEQYETQMTKYRTNYEDQRKKSAALAFQCLKNSNDRVPKAVFVRMVQEYNKTHGFNLPPQMTEVIFAATDDDHSDSISSQEFGDVCDLLQYSMWTTYVDPLLVRNFPGIKASSLFIRLKAFVDSGQLDALVQVALVLNAILIGMESWYDLGNHDTPQILNIFDLIFSVLYTLDVIFHLAVMSLGTYWADMGNRFDMISTGMILAVQVFSLSDEFRIYANMFRVIQLLRLLRVMRLPHVQHIAHTVANMMRASTEVMLFFFVVLFAWGSIGVALYGGQILEAEALNEQLHLWNFNDLPNALFALTIMLLNGWWDDLFQACRESNSDQLIGTIVALAFFLTFYISAVLVAFNIFVPFAVSAFKASLSASAARGAEGIGALEWNAALKEMKETLASQGLLIHIQPTADIIRRKINLELFASQSAPEATQASAQPS